MEEVLMLMKEKPADLIKPLVVIKNARIEPCCSGPVLLKRKLLLDFYPLL